MRGDGVGVDLVADAGHANDRHVTFVVVVEGVVRRTAGVGDFGRARGFGG
jgi:hypothetical protein